MSTRNWYLADGVRRLGPYESDEIPRLVQDGSLRHQTLVWNEEMEGWVAAREVPEMMLYLRGVPEAADAPAGVSQDALAGLIDKVTTEVSAEVMGNMDAYTKDVGITKSGRHVAIEEQASAETAKAPEPAAAAAPAPSPAAPTAPVPVAPPKPVPVAAAASPSVPPSRTPEEPARPATVSHPFGSMPPDPFAAKPRPGATRPTGPVEVPVEFLRKLGMALKVVGFVGLLFGIICMLYAFQTVTGRPVQQIALYGMFLMPLIVGASLFGFGFFLDLWLAQTERLKPVLESVKGHGNGGGSPRDEGGTRRGVMPFLK